MRFLKTWMNVNSTYCVENIPKPFLRDDAPMLYPDEDFLSQRNGATFHRKRGTVAFRNEDMNFIVPGK